MSTQPQARAEERRRRKRARVEQRRQDRALVPVAVAQRLGIAVAEVARAMRAADVIEQITEDQAKGWAADPGSAPQWLTVLQGERLARAAEQEYRCQWRSGWFDVLALQPSAAAP
jgi:hypothetical protein